VGRRDEAARYRRSGAVPESGKSRTTRDTARIRAIRYV